MISPISVCSMFCRSPTQKPSSYSLRNDCVRWLWPYLHHGCVEPAFLTFGRIFSGKISAKVKNHCFQSWARYFWCSAHSRRPCFCTRISHHILIVKGLRSRRLRWLVRKYQNLFHKSNRFRANMANNFRASRGTRGPLGTSSTNKVIVASDHVSEAELHSTSFVEILRFRGFTVEPMPWVEIFPLVRAESYTMRAHKHPSKGLPSVKLLCNAQQHRFFWDIQHASTGRSFFSPKVKFSGLHISGT